VARGDQVGVTVALAVGRSEQGDEVTVQDLRVGLTYDDVILVPRRSRIRSRQDVSTRSFFTRAIEVEVPLVSANMDTVTTAPMAIAMARLGGIGAIHRFLSVPEQVAEVAKVKRHLNYVIESPYSISPSATVAEARAETERHNVTGLVVTESDGRIAGILTARDVKAASSESAVKDAMTPADKLVTAPKGVGLNEARELMHRHRVEKLPLVEDDGRLAGLITLRDLMLVEQLPGATRDDRGRLRVAAAIGARGDYMPRTEALVEAEADAVVLDIAHGHADHAIEALRDIKASWPGVQVVAGNVATAAGFRDLADAGADAVKVGIGPGFACSTRLVAGVGVPQLTAVMDCGVVAQELGVPLIADGGIRRPGDLAKAIAAGASTAMIGSLFAGRDESPGDVVRRGGDVYKVYRGMASRSAAAARLGIEGRADALDQYVPEGEEMEFRLRGPVAEIVRDLVGGLRSGMSYVDAATVEELWDKARFIRQTESGQRESKPGSP
jgi:IMP dehydrogenase